LLMLILGICRIPKGGIIVISINASRIIAIVRSVEI